MLRFWKRSEPRGRRVGLLPAAFNPPTIAHLELARRARKQGALDEVLFLLPAVFPHKGYGGASFDRRLEMLQAALAGEPASSIGSTETGLFIDIARACRPVYGPEARFFFLCGRDAAERIVNWDYGSGPSFAEQLREFELIVAPRGGGYAVPPQYARGIHHLADWPPVLDCCSSSAVREAVAAARPWAHLVPEAVSAIIHREKLYRKDVDRPPESG
jgi:nicotinate (nicotinamide) nucleotide adenylyltransferase